MLILIGVLLLILATATYIWEKKNKEVDENNEENQAYNDKIVEKGFDRSYFKPIKNTSNFPVHILRASLIIGAVILFALTGMFFCENSNK